MTEKIREYKMNGSLIIGVDAGYGNFKTARRVFPTAVSVSDKAPVFARDFIEWNGRYYIIGEGHKGFVTDKVTDDDNYVLTMAAVVKELEARGYTDRRNAVRIHLAVGLPLKWVQAQREDFKRYMLRNNAAVLLCGSGEPERLQGNEPSCGYRKRNNEPDVSEQWQTYGKQVLDRKAGSVSV